MSATDKLSSRDQPVAEPVVVVDLGHGRWMIDRGTHQGHDALFFEPAPSPGPFMQQAPHFAPPDMVQPGTVCIRFDVPEAMTFLRWWLAYAQDPENTSSNPADFVPVHQRTDEATPAARWRAEGRSDPHGDRYDCERAKLGLGNMTDDELANAVFMHGGDRLDLAAVIRGEPSPISLLTAAKDRIRWLSRQLEAAKQATGEAR